MKEKIQDAAKVLDSLDELLELLSVDSSEEIYREADQKSASLQNLLSDLEDLQEESEKTTEELEGQMEELEGNQIMDSHIIFEPQNVREENIAKRFVELLELAQKGKINYSQLEKI